MQGMPGEPVRGAVGPSVDHALTLTVKPKHCKLKKERYFSELRTALSLTYTI